MARIRRSRSRLGLAVAAATLVTLAGCMRADLDLTLRADDGVDGTMIVAVTDSLAWAIPPESEWKDAEVPTGAVDEPYSEGGFTGVRRVFDGTPMDEVFDQPGGLTVTREGREFVVSGAVDPHSTGADADTLSQVVGAGGRATIAITFPGPVTEHNGSLDGRTVSWTLEPGEKFAFKARGGAGSGALSSIEQFLVIGVTVAVVLGAALLALLYRRRGAQPYGTSQQGRSG